MKKPINNNTDSYLEERIKHLEGVERFVIDSLEAAASLGDFQSSINKLQDVTTILEETRVKVQGLIPFEIAAFFLLDEGSNDFTLRHIDFENHRSYIQSEVDNSIDNGTFAWALMEKRPVIVPTKDHRKSLVFHSMSTAARIRGMFIGLLNNDVHGIQSVSLSLFSLILFNSANAIESSDLYRKIREINRNLERIDNYRILFEAAPDGVEVVDTGGNIIDSNDSQKKLLGFSQEQLTGRFSSDYFSKKCRASLLNNPSSLNEKGYWEGEVELVTATGEIVPVWRKEKAIYDNDHKFIGAVVYNRDITDRKRAEEKLRESEEKYRNILENIEDGYFEVDLAGNLTFFNPSICGILGYPAEEMPGMNYRAYMDPENATIVLRAFNEVYLTGISQKGFEWEVIQKNGNRRLLEVSVSCVVSLGEKPIGFRGIARDVTERKMIEALEKGKIRAEEANKAKGKFLANMSHEIRTPLNGILGMAEVCLETTLDEDQKHLIGVITKEASSLLDIINEILDFSKIEAGKIEIEQVPFDLRIFFNDLIESFLHQTTQKGLELISSISPETPTLIAGDPGRLRQILRNLIGNAIKFTHSGRIVVEIEPAEEQEDRIKLKFLVTDTGIGIPKEKQFLVFESFTQADSSTTRKYGGTGLGITISKNLAELMGGEIGVYSEKGKGSTFWFTAAFSKTSVTDLDRRRDIELRRTIESLLVPSLRGVNNSEVDFITGYTGAGEDRKKIRILLAEDYPTNQTIAKRHLENSGYQVDLAENGALALEAFRCRHYDLILMDIDMPVMDGRQATKAIRELETEQAARAKPQAPETMHRVPIIAMTAHAFHEEKELCIEAGMDDFLSKPLTKNELISMVAKRLIISLSRLSISSGEAILNNSSMTGQDITPKVVRSRNPIDLKRAIDEFEGDRELLAEVITGFIEKVNEQIGTMRKALSAGDAETVRREAHSIKGGASGLTAADLSKVAGDLESKGKSKELSGAGEILDGLEREFKVLTRYIEENFT